MNAYNLNSMLSDMQNASRTNRNHVANIVFENKKLRDSLVAMVFETDNKLSIKAAWVLEWICTHRGISFILPYLDDFTKKISTVHFDSVTRPCAKICEHLAIAYTSKRDNEVKYTLTNTHIDNIIETGFDWLITKQKIAVRAYTMTSLYLFGLEKDWVHPELEHLISTKIVHESKGCKARGVKILGLIRGNK